MDESPLISSTDSEETGTALDRLLKEYQNTPEQERDRQREAGKIEAYSKLITNARLELTNLSWPVQQGYAVRELFTGGACAAFAFVFQNLRGGRVRRCNSPAHFWVRVHGFCWDVTGRYRTEIDLLQASFEGVQGDHLQLSDFLPADLPAQTPTSLCSIAGWDELCRIAERLITPTESA